MKDRTLYLECYSGISGDMTVAALLDLGADRTVLMDGLNSLNVGGYRVAIGRRTKNSIDACDFNVILEESSSGHDHAYNYDDYADGHAHEASQEHAHGCLHEHEHDHAHADVPADAPSLPRHHEHRNLSTINSIIEQSSVTDNAKRIAKRIFRIVAAAEAKAHGKAVEEVHFHEVGAVDSIVDIVAAAICLDNLDIRDVVISDLYEGTGFVACQHGILPVPAPAVVNIASEYRLPLHITNVSGELVTPTGAAIAAAIRTKDALPKEMKILKIGLGAGKRSYTGASGLLRAMLIEDASSLRTKALSDKVLVLEANMDDCSGEVLSMAMELLLKNGARDVYYTPIFMKKNRPAYMLGVICDEDKLELMEDIIFTHTTTIGIRRHETVRTVLGREALTVTIPYGDALVKVCAYKEKQLLYPEYESVKKLCEISGKDYETIYQLVRSAAENALQTEGRL